VLAHQNSPALGLVLNALRARVRNHLDAMAAGLAAAGPQAAACLPAFLCAPYLKRMEAPGLNPFKTPIEIPRWRRQLRLWRAARRL
jgi:phytoene synthase